MDDATRRLLEQIESLRPPKDGSDAERSRFWRGLGYLQETALQLLARDAAKRELATEPTPAQLLRVRR